MDINGKLHEALACHQKGSLKQAEGIYHDILKIRPDHFHALHYLGVLYLQLGNLDLAVQYLRRAIETNPADSHAHYNLGIAYQSSGLPDDAVTAYIKSIRLNPQMPTRR